MQSKYPKPVPSAPITCADCGGGVYLILNRGKLIPVDNPPSYYRRYGNPTKVWLNGVDYSLDHKCDGSNFREYEKDAIRNNNFQ